MKITEKQKKQALKHLEKLEIDGGNKTLTEMKKFCSNETDTLDPLVKSFLLAVILKLDDLSKLRDIGNIIPLETEEDHENEEAELSKPGTKSDFDKWVNEV